LQAVDFDAVAFRRQRAFLEFQPLFSRDRERLRLWPLSGQAVVAFLELSVAVAFGAFGEPQIRRLGGLAIDAPAKLKLVPPGLSALIQHLHHLSSILSTCR